MQVLSWKIQDMKKNERDDSVERSVGPCLGGGRVAE